MAQQTFLRHDRSNCCTGAGHVNPSILTENWNLEQVPGLLGRGQARPNCITTDRHLQLTFKVEQNV